MESIQKLTRRPLFWVVQIIVFFACVFLTLQYYPKAFPIVDLQLKMDRLTAQQEAEKLALQNHWGPPHFKQATSFDLDSPTQTYIELAAGGTKAFRQMLQEGLYYPYTWRVRHFAEGETKETQIQFTPQGNFYGFYEHLPETDPGAALTDTEALKIAETAAKNTWRVDLSAFALEEKSKEVQPSGRVDHSFVYERPQVRMGEGRYRLRMTVSGNQLTELSYYIKIPDAFLRHYAEMRSSNETITSLASTAMMVLYLIGGCGLGLLFLAKRRWVLWKMPLFLGIAVAFFGFLEQINQLPLLWMGYDTALSAHGFLLKNLSYSIASFVSECFLLSISFMAAESLSRKAFPHHPQLWKIWSNGNAGTLGILGRTLSGYLTVGFMLAFVVLVYLLGTQYLGWWTPSDILFQPNGLATYLPWFTAISNSLHAGFWEESLFRAVPLAAGALLGQHFGSRRTGIAIALCIQALIFAGGHANYPAEPSYARVVELIIPSLLFGGIYLVFGLLPGIVLHFTFDVVMFSIPLFAASTPRIWIDRLFIIGLTLIPLWIVLWGRYKQGCWKELSPTEFNQAWSPKELNPQAATRKTIGDFAPLTAAQTRILWGAGLMSLLFWLCLPPLPSGIPSLEISKENAILLARETLAQAGHALSSSWQALAFTTSNPSEEDRFIWKTAGPETYRNLMQSDSLEPPAWNVRFVRFDTEVAERAEEFQVSIADKGKIVRLKHDLPESRAGAHLLQTEAREVALKGIEKKYHLNPLRLKEVSSTPSKLPNRTDWVFIFSDLDTPLKMGDVRVGARIAGNQVESTRRFVFVPEAWSRQERNRENLINIVRIFSTLFIFGVMAYGVIQAILHWIHRRFSMRTFLWVFGSLVGLSLLHLANTFPSQFAAQFSTQEPKLNQIVSMLAIGTVMTLISVLGFALILGYVHHESDQSRVAPERFALGAGCSIGLIGTALVAAAYAYLPAEAPVRGSIAGFDSFIPLLSGITFLKEYLLTACIFFLTSLISVRLFSDSRKGVRALGFVFVVLLGFSVAGLKEQELLRWCVIGVLESAYFILAFRYLIRGDLSLIPLAALVPFLATLWKQILLHPFEGSTLVRGTAALFLLILGVLWHQALRRRSVAIDGS